MKHARYIGPRRDLKFCGALVRPDSRSRRRVLVQMNRIRDANGKRCMPEDETNECHGWHSMPRRHFVIDRARSQSHQRKLSAEYWARKVASIPRDRETGMFTGGPKLRPTPRVGTIPGQERR